MKSWTIRQRIITGFAALLLLFSAVAVTSLVLLRQVKANQRDIVEVALPGISFAAHIKANASEIQLAVLRHLIARTPEQKQISEDIIETLRVEIAKNIERYEKTMTAEEDRQRFNQMDAARTAYIKARAPVLELSRANKMDEAEALNLTSLRPAYLAYAKACDELYAYNEAHGNQAGAESQKLLNQTNSVITIATSLAIVLGIAFATVITVGLSRVLQRLASSLDEGANQVVAAAGQVSAASQSLAEGASEQAASLEETSASLEEMASMTKGNAESAAKAKALSNQTRAAADAGATDMGEMKQAMGAIKASSDDISKIIKTIDEIAFQTNILALNAAVEAARAGEAGAGFAVVAEEVRNLAQRSAQSARETAEKIEDSIRKSEHGVHISNKVAQSLGEIVEKAREVDVLVAEIATASQEQSKGIEQVNLAVSQMDTVTQANASGAEESASAAEELSAQAASQKEAVEDLLKLVGSTGRGKRRSAPPSIWKSKPSDKPAKSPTRTQPVRLDHSEANERGQPKLSFAAASTPHVNGHHDSESDHFES